MFPKPSHTEKGGWGFGGYANFALNEAGTWRLESQYRWSVRSHFAPSVKLSHYSPWGRLRFAYSKETSDNNEDPIWITKFPEWEYQSPKVYLGNTGVFSALMLRGGTGVNPPQERGGIAACTALFRMYRGSRGRKRKFRLMQDIDRIGMRWNRHNDGILIWG